MGAPYTEEDKIIEHWPAKAKLMIIDTVDYYILCVKREKINSIETYSIQYSDKSSIFSKVCKMYEEIDIPIDILETPFDVTTDQFKMITDICGKNISIHKDTQYLENMFDKNEDISFQNLLLDLSKIIEFTKIQMFWNSRKNLISKKKSLEHIDNESILKATSNPNKNSNIIEDLETSVEGFSKLDCLYKYINEKDNITNCITNCEDLCSLPLYIIYNTLYNISLLVNDSCNTVKLIENDFPEFVIIDKFTDMSEINTQNIRNFFHKRAFDSIDNIKEKILSFKVLYDIKSNTGMVKDYSEKNDVIMIINQLYEQNTNPNDKIRATEIYKKIEILSKPETQGNLAFRKRVARYLIDIGLTRKRLSDGIYYYGLIEKTINNTSDSLETIEEKRKIDEELHRPPPPALENKTNSLVVAQKRVTQ